MFRYCIIQPIFSVAGIAQNVHGIYFCLLVISYIFIAAAGYIINDYFDLNIDQINKPQKVIIAKVISRRWVLMWHGLLSLSAIVLNVYVDREAHNKHLLSFAAFGCIIQYLNITIVNAMNTKLGQRINLKKAGIIFNRKDCIAI